MRQAHYAASDALHLKQGALAEAALEVSRLEERIRYVVEGRQRAEQRLADLSAQNAAVGRSARPRPRPSWTTSRADRRADEQARCWTRRPRSRPRSCRGWKTPCAARSRGQRAAQHRGAGAAADPGAGRRQPQHRRAGAPVACPPRPPVGRAPGPADARRARLAQLQQQHAAAAEARNVADARLHELSEQVPALDEQRRRRRTTSTASRSPGDLGARLDALRALQEKVQTEGKLKPWLAKHGLEGLAGPVDPGAHRNRLGNRARSRAARAPERAVGRPLDMVRAFRRRRAAGQAGLLFAAAGRRRQHAPHAAAPGRPAAPERRRPEGAAGRLAGRRVHRRVSLDEALAGAAG
jgi:chromosome segregation protein